MTGFWHLRSLGPRGDGAPDRQALRSQSNGFAERLHGTLPDGNLRILGRKTFYEAIEAMQNDLYHHNTERSPLEIFMRCVPPPQTPFVKMKTATY